MAVIPYSGKSPTIGTECFIAPDAWVIGNTTIGDQVSIFFGAVLRGDIQAIRVGSGSNIQEHAMLHSSHGLPDCIVGEETTIGHRAIIHGCTIGNRCIIGMGSVILDGAEVADECIVGAQALVPMHFKAPLRSLLLGVPAKVVRTLSDEEIISLKRSALDYQKVGAEYRRTIA